MVLHYNSRLQSYVALQVLWISGAVFDTDCLLIYLQALLHFIYWDSLPDMEELSGLNGAWASTIMAQHLLAAADQYAMERLRLLCEVKLCDSVAINTVATTLALAEQHQCSQLKVVCLKFVALPENLRGNVWQFIPHTYYVGTKLQLHSWFSSFIISQVVRKLVYRHCFQLYIEFDFIPLVLREKKTFLILLFEIQHDLFMCLESEHTIFFFLVWNLYWLFLLFSGGGYLGLCLYGVQ